MNRYLADESATAELARALAAAIPGSVNGWTILLRGELGAGKSSFARAFIHALGHEGAVPSPTYTIVEPYSLSRGELYHIDLYRIGSEEELHYLGWSDMALGCRLVEWPDRAPGLEEAADLVVTLAYRLPGRAADISAVSPRAAHVVAVLAANPNT